MLPPLRPRLYLISSSPAHEPASCTITYTVHADTSPSNKSPTHNADVASSYLASLGAGSKASVAVRPGKSSFRLPAFTEAHSTPLIMICAGTGLAPFRGFVQDRMVQLREQGPAALAPALLFVGCRSRTADRLYAEEMDEAEREGAVTLRYAFSRESSESSGCGRAQERVLKESEEVKALWRRGARICLCGSNALVVAVRKALLALARGTVEESGGDDGEEALKRRLERVGSERFVVDNFG